MHQFTVRTPNAWKPSDFRRFVSRWTRGINIVLEQNSIRSETTVKMLMAWRGQVFCSPVTMPSKWLVKLSMAAGGEGGGSSGKPDLSPRGGRPADNLQFVAAVRLHPVELLAKRPRRGEKCATRRAHIYNIICRHIIRVHIYMSIRA